MRRKMSQASSILKLLQDREWHCTAEIVEKCYGPGLSLSRVAARIFDLKKRGWVIDGKADEENKTLYWYRLKGHYPVKNPMSQEPSSVAPRSHPEVTQGQLFSLKIDPIDYY